MTSRDFESQRSAAPPVAPAALLLLGAWLAATAVFGFAVRMPTGGFKDVEGYRAVFFHVPLAWTGCAAFMLAAYHSARYLATRNRMSDAAAYAAAETGLVMCFLATVTGMIFAQSQWGVAWNWDPRQTSIFFVLLIYAAYLLIRQAFSDETQRGVLGAAYLLAALAPMIWLVAVFPRTVAGGSLHPEKAPFDRIHWRLMFANFAGMLGLLAVFMRFHLATARVEAKGRERWT